MIKRITRKETLDEVVEIINRRANILIRMSKDEENGEDLCRELSLRAWELEMAIKDIENIR